MINIIIYEDNTVEIISPDLEDFIPLNQSYKVVKIKNGCFDNSCYFFKYSAGTNGGCSCLKNISNKEKLAVMKELRNSGFKRE